MFLVWRARVQDPRPRGAPPVGSPPDGLGPPVMGVLLDGTPGPRDLAAVLVHLASRGFFRIQEEARGGPMGTGGVTEYRFVRLATHPQAGAALEAYERAVMDWLFPDDRGQVATPELDREVAATFQAFQDGIFARLIREGHFERRRHQMGTHYLGLGAGVFAVGSALAIVGTDHLFLSPAVTWAAAALTALPVLAFGAVMPVRTGRGNRACRDAIGFRDYLAGAETAKRRGMITSADLFEAYLPFAIALGVERRWAAAFDVLVGSSPDWYRGMNPLAFRATSFAERLGAFTERMTRSLESGPRPARTAS